MIKTVFYAVVTASLATKKTANAAYAELPIAEETTSGVVAPLEDGRYSGTGLNNIRNILFVSGLKRDGLNLRGAKSNNGDYIIPGPNSVGDILSDPVPNSNENDFRSTGSNSEKYDISQVSNNSEDVFYGPDSEAIIFHGLYPNSDESHFDLGSKNDGAIFNDPGSKNDGGIFNDTSSNSDGGIIQDIIPNSNKSDISGESPKSDGSILQGSGSISHREKNISPNTKSNKNRIFGLRLGSNSDGEKIKGSTKKSDAGVFQVLNSKIKTENNIDIDTNGDGGGIQSAGLNSDEFNCLRKGFSSYEKGNIASGPNSDVGGFHGLDQKSRGIFQGLYYNGNGEGNGPYPNSARDFISGQGLNKDGSYIVPRSVPSKEKNISKHSSSIVDGDGDTGPDQNRGGDNIYGLNPKSVKGIFQGPGSDRKRKGKRVADPNSDGAHESGLKSGRGIFRGSDSNSNGEKNVRKYSNGARDVIIDQSINNEGSSDIISDASTNGDRNRIPSPKNYESIFRYPGYIRDGEGNSGPYQNTDGDNIYGLDPKSFKDFLRGPGSSRDEKGKIASDYKCGVFSLDGSGPKRDLAISRGSGSNNYGEYNISPVINSDRGVISGTGLNSGGISYLFPGHSRNRDSKIISGPKRDEIIFRGIGSIRYGEDNIRSEPISDRGIIYGSDPKNVKEIFQDLGSKRNVIDSTGPDQKRSAGVISCLAPKSDSGSFNGFGSSKHGGGNSNPGLNIKDSSYGVAFSNSDVGDFKLGDYPYSGCSSIKRANKFESRNSGCDSYVNDKVIQSDDFNIFSRDYKPGNSGFKQGDDECKYSGSDYKIGDDLWKIAGRVYKLGGNGHYIGKCGYKIDDAYQTGSGGFQIGSDYQIDGSYQIGNNYQGGNTGCQMVNGVHQNRCGNFGDMVVLVGGGCIHNDYVGYHCAGTSYYNKFNNEDAFTKYLPGWQSSLKWRTILPQVAEQPPLYGNYFSYYKYPLPHLFTFTNFGCY
ncbi:uncharacterized protein LOC134536054 isoform X2 [Bacillus rossius redtenbacheri]|uniref:uncharacterized protein LOC134536054 isoform X2 n=1 Tax=Bacillus rossius redtenbacheri TaxID=93214 RepID=UPI002FDE45DA